MYFNLIEIMLSLLISALMLGVLYKSQLTSVRIFQLQQAIMNIQANGTRAAFLFKNNSLNKFLIKKTARHYANGMAIYSLYMADHGFYKEMIEGVTALYYKKNKHGFDIEIQLTSPPFSKKWFIYAPAQ